MFAFLESVEIKEFFVYPSGPLKLKKITAHLWAKNGQKYWKVYEIDCSSDIIIHLSQYDMSQSLKIDCPSAPNTVYTCQFKKNTYSISNFTTNAHIS